MNPILKMCVNSASVLSSVFLILCSLLLISPLAADDAENGERLALIGFENMEENGEHDYLSALITAVIREDLSNTEGITLLERSLMNRVLEEQKMQISGLFDDTDAVEAGKLLGSDYLAGGGYIVMDTEVLVDVTLITVETGEVVSFSSRGNSEDIIHMAAEKIARALTGKRHIYRTADSSRPIIKETLMPPGNLKLFSPLIDARIYLDGEFYGYTKGDSRVPIEIELQPGIHTIETDLGSNFGIIEEPEILFKHWRKEFRIVPGKSVVLEDPTRHFNDRLYRMHNVLRDSHTFYLPDSEDYHNEWTFSFPDRNGAAVEGSLTLHIYPENDGSADAEVLLIYNHERMVHNIECLKDKMVEFKKTVGLIDFELEISARYPERISASWDIGRNDIYQGLHREEGLSD